MTLAHQVWTTLEILANMDLARLSELSVDAALNAYAVDPWASPADRPGDVSARASIFMIYDAAPHRCALPDMHLS